MRSPHTAALAGAVLVAAVAAGCSSNSGTTAPPATTTSGTHSAGPTSHGTHAQATSTPPTPHATEFNPPGDIPDNAVFVDHVAPGSRVHFTVPEGWARSTSGGVTTFTDKYNSISIEVRKLSHPPTLAGARRHDARQLRRSVTKFALNSIGQVTRQHGTAVHLVYGLDSRPNPVTGKVVRDVAERFEFWHAGQEAILTLTGPGNADNVDPWQTVSDSLQWK
jgi:hypothetical protein